MARITSIQVNKASLTVSGLTINYTSNGYKNTKFYDPCATCDLLMEFNQIEDFAQDKNGEPVILFTDNNNPKGYGYQLWVDFVKSYPFNNLMAEVLLTMIQDKELFATQTARIIKLQNTSTAA